MPGTVVSDTPKRTRTHTIKQGEANNLKGHRGHIKVCTEISMTAFGASSLAATIFIDQSLPTHMGCGSCSIWRSTASAHRCLLNK